MIDFLIVTHGSLAAGLLDSTKLIVGDASNISVLGFDHGDDPEELEQTIKEEIEFSISNGRQLLVFTDLFGGTPSNRVVLTIKQLAKGENVEAIVGVNLSMLLEGLMSVQQRGDVRTIKGKCLQAGLDGIKDLKEAFEL
ncbi:PTS mannose transporter subunit IIAB [Tetragenococcus osmophilus]|uniref:PTS mannose transporter subunit IIAB n=1 Tax=Tetragenococcus osmophilus TaxID=526944 RepID=A0AA37XL25_9ENTE|nr:PTS mannose transporter subunit IIAB [Tetragenococcus osmophilus]AYW48279.1 PTS mannose transporter subunit IIAB [Tetragenococcus osmophilus]GMA54079.1 PTS sugar transporter [Alicyclobacillus contaminans]GMA72031.1 PTS sugar transporter [Tetragenococcus osmophilus]